MNFVMLGLGFVSARHLQAIKDVGGNLLAALDPHDAVGHLDKYFPNCNFFTEFERFDRHCEKLIREGICIDYVSVCSPNYLHDAHCRFGLRLGASVICEKPLVTHPRNIGLLKDYEKGYSGKVNLILQLRYHEGLMNLKQQLTQHPDNHTHVRLRYFTPRGNWYKYSWKADKEKSGGVFMNIAVHFMDLFFSLFGELTLESYVEDNGLYKLELKSSGAAISAEFSIDSRFGLEKSLYIGDSYIDLASGFTDLHTKCYKEIVAGRGLGIDEAKPSLNICADIVQKALDGFNGGGG